MRKVLVKGPALSASGYGEHCRFVLKTLLQHPDEFDVYLLDIPWGSTGQFNEDQGLRNEIIELVIKTHMKIQETSGQPGFDLSLQVTIPNEFEPLAAENIGITAGIEVDRVAPEWLQASNMMKKLIVVSEHAKSGFTNTTATVEDPQTKLPKTLICKTDIDVVGYPVKKISEKTIDIDLETDFNFLTIALMGTRKNLEQTVIGFLEQYSDDPTKGMIVKTAKRSGCELDRVYTKKDMMKLLNRFPDRKCKVYLMHGRLDEEELSSLYQHPKIKAYVSLSHGEGYGLPLFEAAYHGMPIIAPDWSGQKDFLYTEDKKGKSKAHFLKVSYDISTVQESSRWDGVITADSKWCYPKKSSYKERMRDLLKDYDRHVSRAKRLGDNILKEFSEENMHKKMYEAITGESILEVNMEDMPKISIITSVYNGDEYIKEFMEDITRQSIFKEKCELIMIDANSPGNEKEVIDEYIKEFPDNIKYIKLDEDPGIYGVWNTGIKESTGEYLTNANLDDRKSIKSLEEHAKTLMLNDDVSLVYADSFITHKPNEIFEQNTSNGERYYMEDFTVEGMLRGNLPHNNPMWRKSLHESHGEFNADYKSAGDWDFFLRCAVAGENFKKIPKVLGLYFFNPKGMSTNPDNNIWKAKEELEIYKKHSKKMLESSL